MIITKIHVENFGKLNNLNMDLVEGLNQIYKENGWGKTSLSNFIKAMLYGMPAKSRGEIFNYDRTKYMPWQGGKYGGFIEFEAFNKKYRLTRFFGKTPEFDSLEILDLTTNQTLERPNEEIGDILFKVGKESFEVTAFFPQLKFASTTNAQITANLTGVDKFQNDLSNFNNAIKIIDNKILSLKKEKPKKENIDNLKRKITENKTLLDDQNQKIIELKQQLKVYEEDLKINNELLLEAKEKNLSEQTGFDKKLNIEENIKNKTLLMNEYLTKKNEILQNEKLEIEKGNSNEKIKSIKNLMITVVLVLGLCLLGTLCLSVMNIFTATIFIVLLSLFVLSLIVIELLLFFKLKKIKKQFTSNKLDSYKIDLKNIEEDISKLNSEIDILNKEYQNIKQFSNPERKNIEDYEGKCNLINFEILNVNNSIENLKKDLDSSIEINDKLQQNFDEMTNLSQIFDKKLHILNLTKNFMIKARENVSQRFIVPINQMFSNILNKFNLQNKTFVIDTEWNVKENTNYGSKEFQYSSQGLQDIISLCQRLSLISQVYKKEKPIIILDDTFVNLDDKKSLIAKEIVKEFSKNYQILYICCNIRNVIEA